MLGLAWVVVFLPWFRNDPADHKGVNAEELKLLEGSRELVLHDHGMPWYRLLLQRDIAFLGLQYFGFSYTWYFYVTWLPTWLQRVHGLTKVETAGYAMLPLALGGVGSIVSGLLPLSIPRKWVAIGGFTVTGLLILVIPGIQDVKVAMALMALASFSSDLTMPISWNTCVEIGKQYTATVSSTMNMLGNLAGFTAPLVGGIILDHTNQDWNMVLRTMAVAAFMSAACWFFIDPDKSRA